MGNFTADKTHIPEEKRSIFDSFKFWGHRSKHRNFLSIDIETGPKMTEIEDTKEQTPELSPLRPKEEEEEEEEEDLTHDSPKVKIDRSTPSHIKIQETISGNYIISRGWDGNNMLEYKIRRKNY
jgi:hypothetical protein